MRILALDTATQRGSIALVDDDVVVRQAWLGDGTAPRGNDFLAPAIEALLGGEVESVDGFAISIGPGSFTGLRIALAFIKGLVIAIPRPVVAVSTLEAIAHLVGPGLAGEGALAVIDARNGEVFARRDPDVPDGLYRIDALVPVLGAPGIVGGEPPPALLAALPGWSVASPGQPLAPAIARLSRPRFAGPLGDPLDLQPSYGQPAAVDRKRAAVDTPAS